MRILLVEDDTQVAANLCSGLQAEGFEVVLATDGLTALDLLYETSFRVIVLDLMIPKLSGWQLLKLIREEKITTPVVILSALDRVENRVRGLNEGADDYLVKPFSVMELVARLRAILRRGVSVASEELRFKDLVVDTRRHSVQRGERSLQLTPREFSLLVLFLEMKEQVLTRNYILDQIWDMNFNSDGTVVDVCMRRLRAKIDDGFEVKLLHTVRGLGYVLR